MSNPQHVQFQAMPLSSISTSVQAHIASDRATSASGNGMPASRGSTLWRCFGFGEVILHNNLSCSSPVLHGKDFAQVTAWLLCCKRQRCLCKGNVVPKQTSSSNPAVPQEGKARHSALKTINTTARGEEQSLAVNKKNSFAPLLME